MESEEAYLRMVKINRNFKIITSLKNIGLIYCKGLTVMYVVRVANHVVVSGGRAP